MSERDRAPEPPERPKRALYPQRCALCGHSWLSRRWQGPKQCPFPYCTSPHWREGPTYLTKNRSAQGWRKTPNMRGRVKRPRRLEAALAEASPELYPEGLGWKGERRAREGEALPAGEDGEVLNSGQKGDSDVADES